MKAEQVRDMVAKAVFHLSEEHDETIGDTFVDDTSTGESDDFVVVTFDNGERWQITVKKLED